jgi:hypothetical protein
MPPSEDIEKMSKDEIGELIQSYQKFDKKYNTFRLMGYVLIAASSIFSAGMITKGLKDFYCNTNIKLNNQDSVNESQKLINENQKILNVQFSDYIKYNSRDLNTSKGRKEYLNSIKIKQNEEYNIR